LVSQPPGLFEIIVLEPRAKSKLVLAQDSSNRLTFVLDFTLGAIQHGTAGREDVGHSNPIVDALQSLPVQRGVQALRLRGSAGLRYGLSRRLRQILCLRAKDL
jgi:hypothetical protein